ncbi:MAG: hypothetical protein HC771_01200 [Synechococcales cyanobacterium CRU_2_2]|nr:hypothetical protein [Synechococcales cyanobacterium CRU_2_2]
MMLSHQVTQGTLQRSQRIFSFLLSAKIKPQQIPVELLKTGQQGANPFSREGFAPLTGDVQSPGGIH